MSTLFVYNKKAGKNFKLGIVDQISSLLPSYYKHEFVDIREFDDYDCSSFKTLVAIGGDGTVNTVASKAHQLNKTLGIIPKGSGDGLARFLKIPRNIKGALKTILADNTAFIDVAFVSDHFFINVTGTGFEAKVAHKFGNTGIRGIKGYIKAIIELFNTHQEREITLKVDGETTVVKYFSLSIANGAQWGNNFEIASKADIQDGLLDVAIMRKPKITQIPLLLAYLRNHNQSDNKLFNYYKAAEIDIKKSGKKWHIDGEPISLKKKKEVRIVPRSLNIIIP
jgi:diacylglycerol kinase (ATP)